MKRKVVLFAAIITMLISSLSLADNAAKSQIYYGNDRFETNEKVLEKYKNLYDNPEKTAVVTSGLVFADTLTSGNLTYKYKLPLVLEDGKLLSKLEALGVEKVIIIGGKHSVVKSKDLEDSLKSKFEVERIAGSDRYETNREIINYIEKKENKTFDKVGVKGTDFPDALSAIPYTIKNDCLLELSNDNSRVFKTIIGGGVKGSSNNKIAGANRYETSKMVIDELSSDPLIIASGENFPDALSAISLASLKSGNILVIPSKNINSKTLDFIKSKDSVDIIGGSFTKLNDYLNEKKEEPKPEENTEQPDYSKIGEAILSAINSERAKLNLPKLTMDENLNKISNIRAKELQKNFSHTRPSGDSWDSVFDENSWSYFGEYYDFVENLDMESLNPMLKDQEMIEEVFSKAEYTHFGIGFYKADNGYYYTFHLAGNESVDTKPEEKPEEKPNPKLTIEEAKKQILEIVNKERAKNGAGELKFDDSLLSASNVRAEEISRIFSHTRPDGSSCFTIYTGSWSMKGENIAMTPTLDPVMVMDLWMNSPGHRANILNSDYEEFGIGIYEKNGYFYYVQLFGTYF